MDKIVDYSKIIKPASYSNPLTIALFGGNTSLNEGLITTYPIDKTIKHIKDYFNLDSSQIYENEAENGKKEILVQLVNYGDNFKLLNKAFEYCGYFLAVPKRDKIKPNAVVWLQYEAKFESDDTETIRKTESLLYHLTPAYNLKSIKAIGFSPRCKNDLFSYPSRLYFVKGSVPPNHVAYLGEQLFQANSSKGNDGNYALMRLSLSRIPDNVKFHLDPNFEDGIFTMNNIKPNCVMDVVIINFLTQEINAYKW